MASNFKIIPHQNRETLHLKLMGDFDGTSAWQLLNFLKESSSKLNRIIIHTDSLEDIHPFGRGTFHQIIGCLKRERPRLVFTGANADQISPEKDWCI